MVKEKMHLQENTLFDLDFGVKVTWNVAQYPLPRLTICRMRNRRFSKDIRANNFRFRKEDPQKVDKVYLFQF